MDVELEDEIRVRLVFKDVELLDVACGRQLVSKPVPTTNKVSPEVEERSDVEVWIMMVTAVPEGMFTAGQ